MVNETLRPPVFPPPVFITVYYSWYYSIRMSNFSLWTNFLNIRRYIQLSSFFSSSSLFRSLSTSETCFTRSLPSGNLSSPIQVARSLEARYQSPSPFSSSPSPSSQRSSRSLVHYHPQPCDGEFGKYWASQEPSTWSLQRQRQPPHTWTFFKVLTIIVVTILMMLMINCGQWGDQNFNRQVIKSNRQV